MRVLSVIHQADAASGVFGETVRERGAELAEWNIAAGSPPPAPPESYDAVLVFGGAMHVDQEDRHAWLRDENSLLQGLLERGMPILGVCLGAQLIAKAARAKVGPAREPEIGWYDVELTPEAGSDPIFSALPARFAAFQWHSYAFELPPGAVALARNPFCLQAYRLGETTWGIQFHAEVSRGTLDDWIASSRPEDGGGLDLERLRAETAEKIGAWNRIGKRICARFLDRANSR
jgi:GMP synthase-like glutamine amidotransferase